MLGTAGDYPPFSALNSKGGMVGLDVDLAAKIAEAMGVDLVIKRYPFGQLLTALEKGKVDVVLSGMTITPERNTKVLFVGPYYSSGKSLITKDASIGLNGTSAHDVVVAVKGSTSAHVAKKLFAHSTVKVVATFDTAMELLLQGKVTAIVADYPYCAAMSYRYRDKGVSSPNAPFTYEPLGIGIRKSAFHLENWMQNFLFALEGSGELERLTDKWIKNMDWVNQLEALPKATQP